MSVRIPRSIAAPKPTLGSLRARCCGRAQRRQVGVLEAGQLGDEEGQRLLKAPTPVRDHGREAARQQHWQQDWQQPQQRHASKPPFSSSVLQSRNAVGPRQWRQAAAAAAGACVWAAGRLAAEAGA
jgi:hypothetical protein